MIKIPCVNCGEVLEAFVCRDLGEFYWDSPIPYIYKLQLDGYVLRCDKCRTYTRLLYDNKLDKLILFKVGGE